IAMSGFTTAATYAIVTDDLHRPATFIGILGSAQGAGSILGGIAVGWLLNRYGEWRVGAVGAVVFAAGGLIRCVSWWPSTVASAVVVGIGLPWTLVAALTAVQLRTPAGLLGRVSATATLLLFGPIALATPAGSAAVLVERHLALVLAALLCVASVLV